MSSSRNTVTVVIEAPTPPLGHLILSAKSERTYTSAPPSLERSTTTTYEMLPTALSFAKKLASCAGRFVAEQSRVEKRADATGYFADSVSAISDAQLWLVAERGERRADAFAPFGIEQEKTVSAQGYFVGSMQEIIADVFGAFATLDEKLPSALVYFGTMEEKKASAQGVHLHISDVNKIAEFIANYIPQLWHSKEWGVTMVQLKRGEARQIPFPPRKGTNVLKGVLYLSRGEWWLENLPDSAEHATLYNTQHDKIIAFVFCIVL